MPTNHFDLSGKIAVITGGSRGLGREIVLAFADAGADVVITSRKIDSCEELAKEVEEKTGRTAMPFACHVGYWDQCDALIDAVYDRFGRVDVLVNNAGLSPLYPSIAEISEELYDKVFDINVKAVSPCDPSRFPNGRWRRRIDHQYFQYGLVAAVRRAATYGMAKAGLNQMSVNLAYEYGPKVRVNTIAPGPFATDISKAWPDTPEFNARWDRMALKRVGQPDEIVGAALYFASDASSYTTGALLRVCGGSDPII